MMWSENQCDRNILYTLNLCVMKVSGHPHDYTHLKVKFPYTSQYFPILDFTGNFLCPWIQYCSKISDSKDISLSVHSILYHALR